MITIVSGLVLGIDLNHPRSQESPGGELKDRDNGNDDAPSEIVRGVRGSRVFWSDSSTSNCCPQAKQPPASVGVVEVAQWPLGPRTVAHSRGLGL